eukprot:TRINITY_DN26960_c0_g1_i1.p1 TRINITY_DN26960_c0_g1~~TRINITY_DN26960_c0_g1_i1.p1  ORF type:complete len:178 (+),score=61.65 TRINITY_DN26960_c0_g1_i1:101-634(+)
MTAFRRFTCDDLLTFNPINFDPLTETFTMDFYLRYLTQWPQYQTMARDSNGFAQGYVIGKAEGGGEDWHAHVSAVTVAPEARRTGLAAQLMAMLERTGAELDRCYFVDLFMRKSNGPASRMYRALGYETYRTVLGYYTEPEEDALDLRKALPRDAERSTPSLQCDKPRIRPSEIVWR